VCEPSQFSVPHTSYLITPMTILQILIFAFRSLPLRILKFQLSSIHVLFQKLVMLLFKPRVPTSELKDGGVDKGADEKGAEAAVEAESWAGVRRLGGMTLTITVLVGTIRLLVVTVKIVALTLWVPFYPSPRSFLSLCDRFCRSGSSRMGSGGFAVDIRMGA